MCALGCDHSEATVIMASVIQDDEGFTLYIMCLGLIVATVKANECTWTAAQSKTQGSPATYHSEASTLAKCQQLCGVNCVAINWANTGHCYLLTSEPTRFDHPDGWYFFNKSCAVDTTAKMEATTTLTQTSPQRTLPSSDTETTAFFSTPRVTTKPEKPTEVAVTQKANVQTTAAESTLTKITSAHTNVSEPMAEAADVAVIAGSVSSGVVVVSVAVIVIILLVRRKRRSKATAFKETPEESADGTGSVASPPQAATPTAFILQKEKAGKLRRPALQVKPKLKDNDKKRQRKNTPTTDSGQSTVKTVTQKSPLTDDETKIPLDNAFKFERSLSPIPELEDSEDGDTLVKGRNQYRNQEEVYSVYRQSAPELDNVQKYLVDRLASDELGVDFKNIQQISLDEVVDVGKLPINLKKNRFAAIIPYDRNRVVLTDGFTNGVSNDYINASFINGYRHEKEYIATQGPRDNTAGDFWRMVWQENITHIVMLTNLREGDRTKCYQYWPEEDGVPLTHGPVTVTTTHVESRDSFYIRNVIIKAEQSAPREITHYHYVSWPDFGVPTTASLVSFWRFVTSRTRPDGGKTQQPPVLVHCSAGVGRTGTFIALDIAMQQAVEKDEVDLMELVQSLRDQRCLMVQATEQFVFLHTALLEAYTSRDTVLTVDKFTNVFTHPVNAAHSHPRIDKEFRLLMEMRSLTPVQSCDVAKDKKNKGKNRNPEVLPADGNIVYLTETVSGRNQYINAVHMPTFRDSRGCLVTQLPLPSTLVDFWRLVYRNDVTAIVSLSSPNEEKEIKPYCKYWPREKKEKIHTGPYTVSLQCVSQDSDHVKSYSLMLKKAGAPVSRDVRVLHYDGWTGETGDNPQDVLNLMDTLVTLHSSSKSERYIVQCSDGVEKSGMFCALLNIINRLTYDREIDVYMTVRHVQSVIPQAVTSVVQYRYLYEAVQQRCLEMTVYANE